MCGMNQRRSFLARFAAAAAAFGLGQSSASAQDTTAKAASSPSSAPGGRWQPAREAKDEWYDQLPGKHRLVFDSVSPEGVASAVQFTGNFFTGNKNGYGLDTSDAAVIIVMRHRSTQFAFTDAIWSKYGAHLSESEKFVDPKTNQAPTTNVYRNGLENQAKRGVQLAVCDLSTHRLASYIARKIEGGSADAIYKELTANALANVHFVPAGIVAVNRAQEHGYAVSHAG
jgi:intracellular sulfur oxidation DsrE/DsrF family protein